MVEIAPTMLVGVGGAGCEIADRIASLVRTKNLAAGNRLVILGFDTDDNDMKRRLNLAPRRRIRFSTKLNVYQLADRLRPGIDPWFAGDGDLTTEIRQMSLIDGAGQIRMLTRLGLYHALSDPQIAADIDAAASSMAEFGGQASQFAGNVNVLLVGSLAGATGSGSFLQISLLMADRLREKGMQPHVRGLFLLPEVFTRAARLPTGQIPNVLANGYAALRELNALILKAAGRTAKEFRFEYAPGCDLKPDGLPLRSIAMIDYENSVGGNLGTDYEAYKDMAVRAAYTLMFTPIGDRVSSVTVNDAQSMLAAAASDQTRCYAGIGVSAIRYPEAENLSYLSLRHAATALDGDWLRLNRSFEAKMARFEERRRQDEPNLEPPQPGPSFIEDLRQWATIDKVPFYRRIHQAIHVEREEPDGQIISDYLPASYLDALQAHILRAFWSYNTDLQTAFNRAPLDEAGLDRGNLVQTVGATERDLDRDWRAVEVAVVDKPDDIYVNAFQGGETLPPSEWQAHHLQSYILKHGWHPVAVRYFLYCVREELARRRAALNPKERRHGVLNTATIFDEEHNRTKDGKPVEGEPRRGTRKVAALAEKAAKGGLLGLGGKAEFNRFAGEYVEYCTNSHNRIRQFAEEAVLGRVYDRLDRDLEHLAGVLEVFFRDIAALQTRLAEQMAKLDHGRGAFDGAVIVWGDQRARDAMWDEIAPHLGARDDGAKVNEALGRALFDRYRDERMRRGAARLPPFDGRQLFQEQMIDGHCARTIRERFANVFSMSVVAAIRREAEVLERDWRQYFDEVVQQVGYQSQPFLAFHDANAGQRIMFWAISPRNREEIGDESLFNELFSRNQGERPLCEPEFPDTELLCFNGRVNLYLTDLRKLHPGDSHSRNVSAVQQGIYDKEYRAKIARMLEDKRRDPGRPARDFTPHLDREWHKPGILPEIFGDDAEDGRLLRAMVIGFALDLLPRKDEGGVTVTYARLWEHRGTPRQLERLLVDRPDEDIPPELRGRPEVVQSLIEAAQDNERKDRDERLVADIRQSALFLGLTAPSTLARILAITARRTGAQDDLAARLAETLFEEIRAILVRTQTQYEEWRRVREAAAAVQILVQDALDLIGQRGLMLPETLQNTRDLVESLARKAIGAWESQ